MKIYFLWLLMLPLVAFSQQPKPTDWQQLFNGKDLTNWSPKIRGYALNDNFGNTFRVEDGLLKVRYDGYDSFKAQYGHLFYSQPFSYYKLLIEYRFVGDQATDGEGWATRNSGVMVHGQPAATMGINQDFPISIEVQFLGGLGKGPRPTCNLCTPGTHVVFENKLDTRHCIESKSKTYDGDQWVTAEITVLGDSLIEHRVNGELVLSYEKPQVGGGVVSGFDPAVKHDGQLLQSGTISLQSESHPIDFRKVALLNLCGCTDPKASNYKAYYVKSDNSTCKYAKKGKAKGKQPKKARKQ